MSSASVHVNEVRVNSREGGDMHDDAAAVERFDARFRVGLAIAERGVGFGSLSARELGELEAAILGRLSPVFDEIVESWQDASGNLSDLEVIDRELQRRIAAERSQLNYDSECEGCGSRHSNDDLFVTFHGLFLCDMCVDHVRDELRDLQRPLIEALAAEPTMEHALALGFELSREDGRLVWVGDDDDYDGGSHPFTDEQEALECLAEELSFGL